MSTRFFVIWISTVCISASKQRSWIGPNMFILGASPSNRSEHGFAETGGYLFVFGGIEDGECPPLSFLSVTMRIILILP